ncbi:TetR/AcrR family transcriptional regulator [Lentzea albida]|nr:TetR/AcrR family transcriptional regulator [Lentzea albida]
MAELEMGPSSRRRGRGARERILETSERLFRGQGIGGTGMDQLSAEAQVSKRTVYQHFGSKNELVAEYLRRHDPDTMPEVFDRDDLSPRERLLAAFDRPRTVPPAEVTPLCPFIAAAVEIADPDDPGRRCARDYKMSVAARFTETARQAGAADPEQLGEQLALLLDGASARTRALGTETLPTAQAIATILIDNALRGAEPEAAGA